MTMRAIRDKSPELASGILKSPEHSEGGFQLFLTANEGGFIMNFPK